MAQNDVSAEQIFTNYCKGKTPDQVKVITYFWKGPQEGCLSNDRLSDSQYTKMVMQKRDSLNLRSMALRELGIDEDEVKEIPPVLFEGYVFDNAFARRLANGSWVSSAYQVAWLFFSADQVFVFRYTFNMDEEKIATSTDEVFYNDVTSFSTSQQTETAKGLNDAKVEIVTNKFKMVVSGDPIVVSMDGVADANRIIQGMRQKLREKKR